jgi:hypothetical protein
MGSINASVDLRCDGEIAIVTVDNPPVNALKHEVRAGLAEALRQSCDDAAVKAVVIGCAGRTFFAGADITEFGKPPQSPGLSEVISNQASPNGVAPRTGRPRAELRARLPFPWGAAAGALFAEASPCRELAEPSAAARPGPGGARMIAEGDLTKPAGTGGWDPSR